MSDRLSDKELESLNLKCEAWSRRRDPLIEVPVAQLSQLLAEVQASRQCEAEPDVIDTRTVGTRLAEDIAAALNRACAENHSNTPDFILADYLLGCLRAWDDATRKRERWYGRSPNDPPLPAPPSEDSEHGRTAHD